MRMFRNGRYANVAATIALVVALGGTGAYAANTIGSGDIRNGQVKARDLATNAVTSGKVRNGSLLAKDFKSGALSTGTRGPRGAAGPTGAVGPKGDLGATGVTGPTGPARSDSDLNVGECNPGSTTYVVCQEVVLTIPAGRVMLVWNSGWFSTTTASEGGCRLAVDGVPASPGPAEVGESTINTSDSRLKYLGITFVTNSLGAGTHIFTAECKQDVADIHYEDGTLSAIYAGTA